MKRFFNRVMLLFLLSIYFSFDLFGAYVISPTSPQGYRSCSNTSHNQWYTYDNMLVHDYDGSYPTCLSPNFAWYQNIYKYVSSCPTNQSPDTHGVCTCNPGLYLAGSQCVPTCPDGSFQSPLNTCVTCPVGKIYVYNTNSCVDPNQCTDTNAYINNGICQDLHPYDNHPDDCRNHGGHPLLGLGSGKHYLEPTILCLPLGDWLTHAGNDLLNLGAAASPFFRGVNLAKKGVDYLGEYLNNWSANHPTESPSDKNFQLQLPHIKPDNTVDTFPVTTSPTPPNTAPTVDLNAYDTFLRDVYFPQNPSQDPSAPPVVTIADIDRFNTVSETFKSNGADPSYSYTYTPDMGNIWKSTTGTPASSTVYDSPIINTSVPPTKTVSSITSTYPNLYSSDPASVSGYTPPAPYTTVPVSHSVMSTNTIDGIPITRYTNIKNYPDGSSSMETIDFSPTYKKGVQTITNVDAQGRSSTTSISFDAPNYDSTKASTPDAWSVTQTSPVSSTPIPLNLSSTDPLIDYPIDPTTGLPVSPGTSGAVSPGSITPQTPTGQDLINAPMPSYNVPSVGEFVPFDSNPITDMIHGSSELFSNISSQISSTKTVFDNTKLMLEGGWTPPVIPAGSCGDSMAFDFHGRHIDLCPPLVNSTAVASPIVSSVVTIGGMSLAVIIFIGGF